MRIIKIAKEYEDRLRADREKKLLQMRLQQAEERHLRLKLFESVFADELELFAEAGLNWTTEDQELIMRQGRDGNQVSIRCHTDGSFNWKLMRRSGKGFRVFYYERSRDKEFFIATVVRLFKLQEAA